MEWCGDRQEKRTTRRETSEETTMNKRPVGRTRDAGWQIGVSRTIHVDIETAWNYLVSAEGLPTWLGEGIDPLAVAKGETYETVDGTSGEFRSVHKHDRIRLTWQPDERPDDATVQIALTPAKTGCTFHFHTERLHDNTEREAIRDHWRAIADAIDTALTDRS